MKKLSKIISLTLISVSASAFANNVDGVKYIEVCNINSYPAPTYVAITGANYLNNDLWTYGATSSESLVIPARACGNFVLEYYGNNGELDNKHAQVAKLTIQQLNMPVETLYDMVNFKNNPRSTDSQMNHVNSIKFQFSPKLELYRNNNTEYYKKNDPEYYQNNNPE